MTTRYDRLTAAIEQALAAPPRRGALYNAMKRGRDSRQRALATLEATQGMQDRVRAVKERCLANQDALLRQFVATAQQRGAHVFCAKDGAEAIAYILELARQKGVRTVAKSKSLTSEEIEINQPLESEGLEVIETDLGELIIQKVHEKPYHLVFPAVHKTAGEVAEIFRKALATEVPDDIDGIMRVVRKYLRPIFLNADLGMTGANVGIAETGAIVIETNEGNARMVSSIPDLHVCIMGVEKIVDTIEDALLMMLAHPVSAVGQMLTTYVTMMAGRSALSGGNPGRESHIVILDNGRSAMRQDPVLHDALHCIRCGACMNICPTYGVVGGHSFGYIYPGPIGIPWTAAVHGLEKAGDFAPLCISCGLCKEICPAHIDIPMMIAEVKDRDAATHPRPRVNRLLMDGERAARLGSLAAPVSNWLMGNGLFRTLLEKAVGIDRRPSLPPFARVPFSKSFGRRKAAPPAEPARHVAYFVDVFANHNRPDLAHAAVAMLERAGCAVEVPKQRWSAYPAIGYGDLDRARDAAQANVAAFVPYVERGYDVIATEPTAAYCLKTAYPTLLPDDAGARQVAVHSHEFFEYVLKFGVEPDTGAGAEPRASSLPPPGARLGFHISCHQRPLGAGSGAVAWLHRQGYAVEIIETGTCCGMGGTFGLKHGALGHNLANAVGEPLFRLFEEAGVDAIVTESSVCGIHLRGGTRLPVYHPLEFV